ncbi:MAG: nuclear transport factor 2 family protein [Acidobacteria bacterium]|nr:nuclear transport factor 2 family protein [Acidobacteriota bacterium]
MRRRFKLAVFLLFIAVGGNLNLTARGTGDAARRQAVANEIIAREKASFAAWQRKDKAFYADYWAEDFTEFLPSNPYLDHKANLMPKFEQLVEHWKLVDFQMYNPQVQVYGDVAVLTYNESISGTYDGQPSSYTGKVTMVYVKQGNTWRGAHYHESQNPAAR